MEEEFVALDAPPFAERGAVTKEYLRAYKELWTSDNPTFEGKYCRFSNIDFLPKPVQKPKVSQAVFHDSPESRILLRAIQTGRGESPPAPQEPSEPWENAGNSIVDINGQVGCYL